ncbi:hypothetical protein EEI76_19220 [Enterobacter cloacae]|nr:hypothetical protein EEI76_19220 [Enterobacter cloacae]
MARASLTLGAAHGAQPAAALKANRRGQLSLTIGRSKALGQLHAASTAAVDQLLTLSRIHWIT